MERAEAIVVTLIFFPTIMDQMLIVSGGMHTTLFAVTGRRSPVNQWAKTFHSLFVFDVEHILV